MKHLKLVSLVLPISFIPQPRLWNTPSITIEYKGSGLYLVKTDRTLRNYENIKISIGSTNDFTLTQDKQSVILTDEMIEKSSGIYYEYYSGGSIINQKRNSIEFNKYRNLNYFVNIDHTNNLVNLLFPKKISYSFFDSNTTIDNYTITLEGVDLFNKYHKVIETPIFIHNNSDETMQISNTVIMTSDNNFKLDRAQIGYDGRLELNTFFSFDGNKVVEGLHSNSTLTRGLLSNPLMKNYSINTNFYLKDTIPYIPDINVNVINSFGSSVINEHDSTYVITPQQNNNTSKYKLFHFGKNTIPNLVGNNLTMEALLRHEK